MNIFISHASKDVKLGIILVEFLINLGIKRTNLYFTSDIKQIKSGVAFVSDIKNNLLESNIVFFIVTRNYLESKFCLAELGAAWITDKKIFLLLFEEIDFTALKDTPVSNLQMKRMKNRNEVESLIDELKELNCIIRKTSNLSKLISSFIEATQTYYEEYYNLYLDTIDAKLIKINEEKEVVTNVLMKMKYSQIVLNVDNRVEGEIELWKQYQNIIDNYGRVIDSEEILTQIHPECSYLRSIANKLKSEVGNSKSKKIASFLEDLTKPDIDIYKRKNIGLELAKYGDPREGVLLNEEGIPDIKWVTIKEGKYLYDYNNEKRNLSTYYISKYVITQTQFKAFIEDKYFNDDDDECYYYNMDSLWEYGDYKFEQNTDARRNRESYIFISAFNNYPMSNITWAEANAFCNWLSIKLDLPITLPSAEEWEKAARGPSGRVFGYGNYFEKNLSNTIESGLNDLVAVGLFPLGSTRYGLHDTNGNVWQWTSSEYNKSDGFINKGGSFGYSEKYARAFSSGYKDINYKSKRGGFRVVTKITPFNL